MRLSEMKEDHASGMSPTRIGIRQGMSAEQVRRVLRNEGLDIPDRWVEDTSERDAKIRALLADGDTYKTVARRTKSSIHTVRKIVREDREAAE